MRSERNAGVTGIAAGTRVVSRNTHGSAYGHHSAQRQPRGSQQGTIHAPVTGLNLTGRLFSLFFMSNGSDDMVGEYGWHTKP